MSGKACPRVDNAIQSVLEDLCRRKVATRSLIEAGWSTYVRAENVAKERGRSRSLVFANGLRFNCKNLAKPSGGSFFGLRAPPKKPVFDFRAHFCQSAPVETHAFGFRLPAQRPGGPNAISYQFSLGGVLKWPNQFISSLWAGFWRLGISYPRKIKIVL
jgi:hypothetical protein